MSSYAATASKPGEFTSSSGLNYSEGMKGLTELGNRYKDNPTISGLVIGGLADSFRTQANIGLAGLYNDTFLSSQAKYQRGLDEGRKGDTMEIMAAEVAGARGLQKGQIEGAIGLQAETNRGNLDVQRETTRGNSYVAELGLKGVESQAGAQRYGAEMGLKGIESQTAAQRYVADQSLAGQRYGFDSQERQIGLTGAEERKTLDTKTDQELRLRADARGAIGRQNARFYG